MGKRAGDPGRSADVEYEQRILDRELDELLSSLPALAIEGAKGVGKTATAARRARTVIALDDPGQLAVISADPTRIQPGAAPGRGRRAAWKLSADR